MRLRLALTLVLGVGVTSTAFPQILPKPAWLAFEVGGLRLEGDQHSPSLGPACGFGIGYHLSPYASVSLVGSAGWSGGTTPEVPQWDKTVFARVGGEFRVVFLPTRRVTPFVIAGAGLVYWDAWSSSNKTIVMNGQSQSATDPYLQTGGGLEYRLNPRLSVHAGFRFEYNLTDRMDMRPVGSEDDQTVMGFVGISLRFGHWYADDPDDDGVPNALDLKPSVPEDRDGYMDHDGAPEPDALLPVPSAISGSEGQDKTPPVVLHYPVHVAIENRPVRIVARVYEDRELKVVALLHRRVGAKKWDAVRMRPVEGNVYEGEIPAYNVQKPGVEYCVVAADRALSGLGYSGILDRPNLIRLVPAGLGWRIVGGLLAGAGWGAAGYLIWNRQ